MKFHIAGDAEYWGTPTPSGEQYAQDYIMQYDRNGHKHLEPNGLRDLQEIIQKDLESTKLQNIIDRCIDRSELIMNQKQEIDLSEMPETLMEANNLMIRLKEDFDHLPAEIRRRYNQSAEQYIADMTTGGGAIWHDALQEINAKMNGSVDQKNETKEEPKE